MSTTDKPIISADSHIAEPPNCYLDYIEPGFKDRAPHIEVHPKYGDVFVIDGLDQPIPMGLIAAAGKKPSELTASGVSFDELPRSSWDATHRVADQETDGISAEIIYPTVGMMLCNHPEADYHDPMYDPLWEAAVDMDMPLSFHILTSKADQLKAQRGPKINSFLGIMRGCQDILGTFVFGGVFERHPELKVVCAEADAGWVPHFIYRMDHAYGCHRYWMKAPPLEKMPSEYFLNNIYLTFQDDWTAFKHRNEMNPQRLMWANDFPHSDSTWPWSQGILEEHTQDMSQQEKDWILHDNVSQCYNLPI